ncbi:putative bifunctional diguanylate cyclase/phosphodiesterase [Methylomonas rivi]|uniref:EAL domain-containing protein n=1 Tax=Methylomonas rivi TaxID=2952226 RepID=A0ABT1U822_9GAMM|nr:EAL domain-containing protein [Methylomonas sp. WSC-6]MCQ8129231.1 EAL domain-containing protein [Methylomonas sp. WSC-6]
MYKESLNTTLSLAQNHYCPLNPITLSDGNAGKVRTLLRYVEPVFSHENCLNVLNRFIGNEQLQSISVIDINRRAVGIIDRGKISDIFLKPFSRDLLGKKQIGELMDVDPVVVDINASIDDVAQIIIDSGMRHMVSGFIIHENGFYAGMATGLSLLEEITHRKQQELFALAHHDQLTGLPNRLLFKDRLLQACQNADRNNNMLALVFVDIDRFKFINDSMGHSTGDRLLQFIAERLAKNIRQSDTVARLGGDEFVLILQNLTGENGVLPIVSNIVEQLRQPVPIYEHTLQVTASMGIALYPLHGNTADDLVHKADIAMYEVKQRGRNSCLMFAEGMEYKTKQRVSLETHLRSALRLKQLSLCYQPQIDLKQGCISGVEALLRWRHPELGNISPATFIPIAEETGLIIQIGEWVLREAISQHIDWLAQGLPPLRIAVNISAVQFQHDGFLAMIKRLIAEYAIDSGFLELELTEGVVMKHAEKAVKTLTELRELGLKLAIDDFGTGYSSLNYLRKFPIDRIKIDQSFVRGIENTPANEAIVKAIIALGESLGLETLAEGVENIEELDCIVAHNCIEAQGYHFAKALTAGDLVAWFRSNPDMHKIGS